MTYPLSDADIEFGRKLRRAHEVGAPPGCAGLVLTLLVFGGGWGIIELLTGWGGFLHWAEWLVTCGYTCKG